MKSFFLLNCADGLNYHLN